MNKQITEIIKLEKFIYGGQALGQLSDGKKVFVWGGLPGETVKIQITKSKKNWAEAIVEEVITPAKERVVPKDPESYLSTSPWQILNYDYENKLKQELVTEQFAHHDIKLKLNSYSAPVDAYNYRNKVEFSFWWSNETNQLDLAFFKRGTHYKQPVDGTSLAQPEINEAAIRIRDYLRTKDVEARDLKTLLIRCNQKGEVIAQLYVKDDSFNLTPGHEELKIVGLSIHYSNPKSPASIKTKTLFTSGITQLTDTIFGHDYTYAVDGFFQVTLSMYEEALRIIKNHIPSEEPLLDMYSGVGTIGLSVVSKNQSLTLVEVDERCINEATNNAKGIKSDVNIVHASSESALENIAGKETVILDPPRAGLHQKVTEKLLETTPETIIYLSCNPATQARDIALLQTEYKISYAHCFNFFPRTPHIENLIVLKNI